MKQASSFLAIMTNLHPYGFRELATLLAIVLLLDPTNELAAQSHAVLKTQDVYFENGGIRLAGTIYKPAQPHAAVVIVHGSDQVPRMSKFAEVLANRGLLVLTYDKRGVGDSGGIYAGPEVGTNNISTTNLNLLANDASAAVDVIHQQHKNIPIGLLGFSQAGWIIPIAASKNPLIEFMVLFSCPTITTLEQLRFQFYTDGRIDFWENHTEADAREHIANDPDRYQFAPTDPKEYLHKLELPGLWIFGEKDIQIPAKLCLEQLNSFQAKGKPFEYVLFPSLGHNTAFSDTGEPLNISLHWIKQKAQDLVKMAEKAH